MIDLANSSPNRIPEASIISLASSGRAVHAAVGPMPFPSFSLLTTQSQGCSGIDLALPSESPALHVWMFHLWEGLQRAGSVLHPGWILGSRYRDAELHFASVNQRLLTPLSTNRGNFPHPSVQARTLKDKGDFCTFNLLISAALCFSFTGIFTSTFFFSLFLSLQLLRIRPALSTTQLSTAPVPSATHQNLHPLKALLWS